MSEIHTYPEMDAKLVKILRISENPTSLYAAQRIEELETENQRLRDALGKIQKTYHEEEIKSLKVDWAQCAWKMYVAASPKEFNQSTDGQVNKEVTP